MITRLERGTEGGSPVIHVGTGVRVLGISASRPCIAWSADNIIRVDRLDNGLTYTTLTNNVSYSSSPKIPVSTLAISGEGDGEGGIYLAAGQNDSMISMWDITEPDRREQRMTILRGHVKAVSSLTFAGNKVLVSGSEDGKVCTWRLTYSVRTLVNQWRQWDTLEGHVGSVLTVTVRYTESPFPTRVLYLRSAWAL